MRALAKRKSTKPGARNSAGQASENASHAHGFAIRKNPMKNRKMLAVTAGEWCGQDCVVSVWLERRTEYAGVRDVGVYVVRLEDHGDVREHEFSAASGAARFRDGMVWSYGDGYAVSSVWQSACFPENARENPTSEARQSSVTAKPQANGLPPVAHFPAGYFD